MNIEETLRRKGYSSVFDKDDEFIAYRKEDIEEIIKKLQTHDTCLICKHRQDCKHADSVREAYGLKSNEMWFYCFRPKDEQ